MNTADADVPRAADAQSTAPASADARAEALPRPSAADGVADHATPRGCPFLLASSGGWRLDMPSREHRCAAFSPPAPLSPEKQVRLCLTSGHTGCATYLASLAAREARVGAVPVARATRWGLARTTSIIEDPGGLRGRFLGAVLDRRRWPAIPAVLLVTTLFTLALSGLRTGAPPTAAATASPGQPGPTPASTPRVSPHPLASAGSATPNPVATGAASPAPAGTTQPSPSFRTYRVVSGDTLGAIASRFGVTVGAIARLNNISNPERLQIGQVLLIP